MAGICHTTINSKRPLAPICMQCLTRSTASIADVALDHRLVLAVTRRSGLRESAPVFEAWSLGPYRHSCKSKFFVADTFFVYSFAPVLAVRPLTVPFLLLTVHMRCGDNSAPPTCTKP